jgi:hypothetical protein
LPTHERIGANWARIDGSGFGIGSQLIHKETR